MFFATACSLRWLTPCPNMRFERLRTADRVVVRSDTNKALRTISDPASISLLVAFAEAHANRWGTPWYGPPVEVVSAGFYSDSQFLGDLGVGDDFLSAQGCGGLQSRPVSTHDRAAVMQLFGVGDPYDKLR